MVWNYKKKTNRCDIDESNIKKAMDDVACGKYSCREASFIYNINRTTLIHQMKKKRDDDSRAEDKDTYSSKYRCSPLKKNNCGIIHRYIDWGILKSIYSQRQKKGIMFYCWWIIVILTCYYNAIKFCRENGKVLHSFPPHTSHKLQPLDVGVFAPFKSYLKKSINNFMINHSGQRASIYDYSIPNKECLQTNQSKKTSARHETKHIKKSGTIRKKILKGNSKKVIQILFFHYILKAQLGLTQ